MKILNDNDIKIIGLDWPKTVNVIEEAVKCLANNDFAQPVKPYLRYRNPKNRIIAMPAFIGGDFNIAGIKWISSFPDNINKGLPRAHSVVILNSVDTGKPEAIINSALLSVIRTSSVSGFVIKCFAKTKRKQNFRIGITGFGPIGQYHVKMCQCLLKNKISEIIIYDIRQVDLSSMENISNLRIANCWEEAYIDSDIFITCTVSEKPYIDKKPMLGSLHLNVSLRDYKTNVFDWFRESIIVDDWDEVCRESTDIEKMYEHKGLKKEDVRSIVDIKNGCLKDYDLTTPIMFNPMGMAIFDLVISNYYFKEACIQ